MKQYKTYKDSGVEWIGEIPEHWEVKRLKNIAIIKTGYTPLTSVKENFSKKGTVWVKPDNLNGFQPIKDSKIRISEVGLKKQNLISKNSILLCCIGTIGKFGVAGVDLITNQQINAVTFTQEVNSNYGKYLFFISEQELKKWSNGNVVSILNMTSLGNINFPLPPPEEQTQIANYLNHKTEQLDSLIAKKEQLIKLLEEERKAIINQAVTKGINPNVPMKDSGIEWLGEIPAHWEVKKLKYVCHLISDKTKEKPDYVLALENIQSWSDEIIGNPFENKMEGDSNLFKTNDILFNKLRPYLAKVVKATRNGGCVGELLVLRPEEKVSPDFLYQRLSSEMIITIVDGSTYGTKMPRASWDKFISNIEIGVPPLEEQEKIAKYIEFNLNEIKKIITKSQQEIDLLKEYKTALIREVVTGKIDVREEVLN